MVPQWKRWLGAAAVLLLIGAGCQAAVKPEASLEGGADLSGEMQDDGKVHVDTDATTSIDADIDADVDDALKESDADAAAGAEEESDADVMNNDAAELNAYGQAYVESETR